VSTRWGNWFCEVDADRVQNAHFSLNSDLTIVCKGREWKAHRSVVAARCAFFMPLQDEPLELMLYLRSGGCFGSVRMNPSTSFQELIDQFCAREKIEPAHVIFGIRETRLRKIKPPESPSTYGLGNKAAIYADSIYPLTATASQLMLKRQSVVKNARSFEHYDLTNESKVSMDDDDPDAVDAMLRWLYSRSFGFEGPGSPAAHAQTCLSTMQIALKYRLPTLQERHTRAERPHPQFSWRSHSGTCPDDVRKRRNPTAHRYP
jgi:hypothetical protein